MKNIKIIIATTKVYPMPEDPMYLPVQVGAQGKDDIGYQRDDQGINISGKNPMFCELTGLYWAWKNLDCDYIGLAHYRRRFKGKNGSDLTNEEASLIFDKSKIIVPGKRRYYIETLKSHYDHTHFPEDLEVTRKVIEEICPDYLPSYDKAVGRTWGYMFNMCIMERSLLDRYCSWVFQVLDEVVKRIDVSGRSAFETRYPGRISEIIYNAWLLKMMEDKVISPEDIAEVPLYYTEKEKVFAKGVAFLKAKFLGKKQEKSF